MTLTAAQKKRLAEEARRLAMECVEGTASRLGGWPQCAAGRIGLNAGVIDLLPDGFPTVHWHEYADLLGPEARVVALGNDDADSENERRERVVFPLLALADALEES